MRSAVGILDQGLVSLTGLGLTLLAATTLDVAQFRLFAVVYATHLVCLALMRANFGDVLVVAQDFEARSVQSLGLVVSILLGVLVAGVAWSLSGSSMAVWGGAASAAALWHDVNRYVQVARARFIKLAVADAFVLAPIASLVVPRAAAESCGYSLYAAWIIGALAGALYLFIPELASPGSFSGGIAWHRSQRHRIRYFLGEALASSAGYQLTLLAIAFLVGTDLVAGLRGAQIFAGPLGLVFLGLVMVYTREAAARHDSGRGLLRGLTLTSIGLFLLALLFGVALQLDVGGLASRVLSAQWENVAPFVLPAMVYASASMLNLAPVVLIRASGQYGQGVAARAINSALVLLAVPCAVWAGVEAAAWFIAMGNLVGVAFWWRGLGQSLKANDRSTSDTQ